MLSETEIKIIDAHRSGKIIKLWCTSGWYEENRLHVILTAVYDGVAWVIVNKTRTIDYGVYLYKFYSEIRIGFWSSDNIKSKSDVEATITFVAWVHFDTCEIEVN